MLNKRTDAPVAAQVELARYEGSLGTRYAGPVSVRRRTSVPHEEPPDPFVLFHRDLCTAGMARGVLTRSEAADMWKAIARNVDSFDPTAELDAEPAAHR